MCVSAPVYFSLFKPFQAKYQHRLTDNVCSRCLKVFHKHFVCFGIRVCEIYVVDDLVYKGQGEITQEE